MRGQQKPPSILVRLLLLEAALSGTEDPRPVDNICLLDKSGFHHSWETEMFIVSYRFPSYYKIHP